MMHKPNNSASFNRTWNDFKVGFGFIRVYYWLGNEQIHQLTINDGYKLRIDIVAEDMNFTQEYTYWAEYSTFIVRGEANNYQLTINGYSGDAGDILDVTTMPTVTASPTFTIIPYGYSNALP